MSKIKMLKYNVLTYIDRLFSKKYKSKHVTLQATQIVGSPYLYCKIKYYNKTYIKFLNVEVFNLVKFFIEEPIDQFCVDYIVTNARSFNGDELSQFKNTFIDLLKKEVSLLFSNLLEENPKFERLLRK